MQAIENTGEAIIITDPNGVIEYVNPAFTETTGYLPEEAIGKNPSILKSDAQDEAYYKELWQTITAGHVWCVFRSNVTPDSAGTRHPIPIEVGT